MQGSMPSHPIEFGLCGNHEVFRRGINTVNVTSPSKEPAKIGTKFNRI